MKNVFWQVFHIVMAGAVGMLLIIIGSRLNPEDTMKRTDTLTSELMIGIEKSIRSLGLATKDFTEFTVTDSGTYNAIDINVTITIRRE